MWKIFAPPFKQGCAQMILKISRFYDFPLQKDKNLLNNINEDKKVSIECKHCKINLKWWCSHYEIRYTQIKYKNFDLHSFLILIFE